MTTTRLGQGGGGLIAGLVAGLLLLPLLFVAGSDAAPPAASSLPAPLPAVRRATRVLARLPVTVGAWTRADTLTTLDAETIFDYMNGAAELYVGYRFRELDVCEYMSTELDDIVVELYWMKSSADAYGVLSNDWRGQSVVLGAETEVAGEVPGYLALYDGGRLRLWSGELYATIMSYRQSAAARQAVLDLGRAVVNGRRGAAPPALADALPAVIGIEPTLERRPACYLRSHHVLNSIVYLSTENILDLGLNTELVVAAYAPAATEAESPPVRLLLVRYPTAEMAAAALRHYFQATVLAGGDRDQAAREMPARDCLAQDGGWTAYGLTGRRLALALAGPDESAARLYVDQVLADLATGAESQSMPPTSSQ